MRYSFVGIPIPVVEEDSAEECWSLFGEESLGASVVHYSTESHLLIEETEVNFYLVRIQALQ